MEETTTKTKERFFYIRVSNMHLENSKPLFVGPFKDKNEAEEAINKAMYNGMEIIEGNEIINDPKTLNVEIVGGTVAKREGMKEPLQGMPEVDKWIDYFPEGDYQKSNRGRPSSKKVESSSGSSETTMEAIKTTIAKSKPAKKNGITILPKKAVGKMNINPEETVIVTSNMEIIEWLRGKGIKGQIISFVNNAQLLRGKTVIHISLPSHLIKYAERLGMINLDKMEPGDRQSPTAEKMNNASVEIDWIRLVHEKDV